MIVPQGSKKTVLMTDVQRIFNYLVEVYYKPSRKRQELMIDFFVDLENLPSQNGEE